MSRILFVMPYARYLRLYGTTITALAARGHDVLIAYDKPEKAAGEAQVPEEAPPNVRVLDGVPAHGGPWRDFLIALGTTIDYVRFMSPRFATTRYLRGRMEKYLPRRMRWLTGVHSLPAALVRLLFRLASWVDGAIPVDRRLVEFLAAADPSVVVITPLVVRGPTGAHQTQVVKAARALRRPVVLAVGSWDHLTSKGFIRAKTDGVIVWNETQKREAVELHGVPADRVAVTGAQPFDAWFGRQPSLSRDAFLARVGLPAGQPYVLYVGSSRGIAEPSKEMTFVSEWIAAIRGSADPALRGVPVLVRPHPFNIDHWSAADLSGRAPAAVWPRRRPTFPMNRADADDYFHSLYYSAAIVGINTSAMIEAAIVGRQVYTVQVPAFAATQEGTVHFHYLVPEGGGCVQSAHDLAEHVRQLAAGLRDPAAGAAARAAFVRAFVRPNGLDRPSAPQVADAIERRALRSPAPAAASPADRYRPA